MRNHRYFIAALAFAAWPSRRTRRLKTNRKRKRIPSYLSPTADRQQREAREWASSKTCN